MGVRVSPGAPVSLLSVARTAQLAVLTKISADDLVDGFGFASSRFGRRVLQWLCSRPAQRFARASITYDDVVGSTGLAAGGAWAVDHFGHGLTVEGRCNVPSRGPVLIVANHPGLFDTTALFAAIGRPDLRIVAADRPFLRALPHTSRHLLYLDDAPLSRTRVIRSVLRHLQAGGAALTFPAGVIEPDPAVLPGAEASLRRWRPSIALFARLVQEGTIVPAVVSGVLSPRALRHPLTRLRRRPADRQWLAGLLQIRSPALQDVRIHVAFGPALRLGGTPSQRDVLYDAIITEAARLIGRAQAS